MLLYYENHITLFPLLLPFLLFTACSDDDKKTPNPVDQLPPAAQTGKNTFGCLVNGKVMKITSFLDMSAIYQGGFIQFGGGNILIVALDTFETGISYDLTNVSKSKARLTTMPQNDVFCFYEFEDTYEGQVKFSKIDKINYIISGTFEFSTVTKDCDTIKITDGRFDMQYIP